MSELEELIAKLDEPSGRSFACECAERALRTAYNIKGSTASRCAVRSAVWATNINWSSDIASAAARYARYVAAIHAPNRFRSERELQTSRAKFFVDSQQLDRVCPIS